MNNSVTDAAEGTAEPRPGMVAKVRPVIVPADFQATAERVLSEFLAEHPAWRAYGETRMIPFFTELRTRIPFALEPADRPEHQTEMERQEFQQVWYRECKLQFGLTEPVRQPPPPVDAIEPVKFKQRNLF